MERLLVALTDLQHEVRATREEGHERHEANRRIHAELRTAIASLSALVEEHGATLGQHDRALAGFTDQLEAHHRLIQTLTNTSSQNSILLAEHAKLIGELKETLAGVKEWAREAKQAASELATANAGFQAAVQQHVGGLATTFNQRADTLEANDKAQHDQNVQILQALGASGEQDKDGKPTPGKLDQLQTAGKIAVATTAGSTVLLILKIIYELVKAH